jgi:hypothetical protein
LIQETVEAMQHSAESATISERHGKILDWIKLSDPSIHYNPARIKHQPTTGEWFLESEQFVSWKEGRISCLWLHGIPGTWKTILCSTIIDHIDEFCKQNARHMYLCVFLLGFQRCGQGDG